MNPDAWSISTTRAPRAPLQPDNTLRTTTISRVVGCAGTIIHADDAKVGSGKPARAGELLAAATSSHDGRVDRLTLGISHVFPEAAPRRSRPTRPPCQRRRLGRMPAPSRPDGLP